MFYFNVLYSTFEIKQKFSQDFSLIMFTNDFKCFHFLETSKGEKNVHFNVQFFTESKRKLKNCRKPHSTRFKP